MKKFLLFFLLSSISVFAVAQKNITVAEAKDLIAKNKKLQIVDVRTPEEFKVSSIEKAKNIDYKSESFRNNIKKLKKKRAILLYCRSGRRSYNAMKIMVEELGFKEVYNLSGGILAWERQKE